MILNAATVYGFVKGCLLSTYDNPQPIPDFHKTLWNLCCSEDKYVAIAAPRGHAKSTALTLSYALSAALFRDAKFLIILSDTEGQSSNFLGDIKAQLIENEDIHSLFGKARFIKDSETNIIVEMPDGHQFRIMAKGAGQRLRGLKWRNKRPDLVLVDDLEDDEAVESKERRNKLYRWFTNAVMPCLSDDGRIRVAGTILHMDSVLEKLLNKESWITRRYAAHNEDFSEILWPEKFPKEKLVGLRDSYVEDGNPSGYSQEYLSYPIDESTAYFRRDDFQAFNKDTLDYDRLSYYSAVDFAISEKDSSDYTVIATVGIDEDNKMYVVDVDRGRWDSKEIIDKMMTKQVRYNPELFTVETGMIQKSLGPFLKEEMLRTGVFLNLKEMTPVKDKQTRARSLQARLRQGTVFFDTRADWYPDIEQEMVRFPRDKHDDMVDALAWIGLTLNNIVVGQTKQEHQEELEEDYWDEMDGNESFGICTTGGY